MLKLYFKIASESQANLPKIIKRVDNIFAYLDLDTQVEISLDLIEKKFLNESLWVEISEVFESKFDSLDSEVKVSIDSFRRRMQAPNL